MNASRQRNTLSTSISVPEIILIRRYSIILLLIISYHPTSQAQILGSTHRPFWQGGSQMGTEQGFWWSNSYPRVWLSGSFHPCWQCQIPFLSQVYEAADLRFSALQGWVLSTLSSRRFRAEDPENRRAKARTKQVFILRTSRPLRALHWFSSS